MGPPVKVAIDTTIEKASTMHGRRSAFVSSQNNGTFSNGDITDEG